jgi:hypothetical protein
MTTTFLTEGRPADALIPPTARTATIVTVRSFRIAKEYAMRMGFGVK